MPRPRLWDIFCRVIDNFGDIGVCWRMAADLAGRGDDVRLWVDDPSPLAWMAPGGAPRVRVIPWTDGAPALMAGDVVIEAFGCDPPAEFVRGMSLRSPPPCWINLEYLSAEGFVERSHGLPSPQPGGLTKWFFYPGFTGTTGGLPREPGLLAERADFDRADWLRQQGLVQRAGERIALLFCYEVAPIQSLLEQLADEPTLVLLAGGPAQEMARGLTRPADVRTADLPWLSQPEFDRALWSSDLNLVRGEDSLVRAIWAGVPFVWQLYPQDDGAHAGKLEAFITQFTQRSPASDMQAIAAVFRWWNGLGPRPREWPDESAWTVRALEWRAQMAKQADLVSQLVTFVDGKG